MENIIENIQKALQTCHQPKTADIRNISAHAYKMIEEPSYENVMALCERLLTQKTWQTKTIAFDWAYRQRKNYNHQTFQLFESWLISYVRGWGDCDDFCTHALGSLVLKDPQLSQSVLKWTSSPHFWVRRAAAVVFILPIRRGTYHLPTLFQVVGDLMHDSHYLVLKGYGWMMKELSQQEPRVVYDYLVSHKTEMPRVAFRYALEKLSAEAKNNLMAKPRTH